VFLLFKYFHFIVSLFLSLLSPFSCLARKTTARVTTAKENAVAFIVINSGVMVQILG